MSEKHLPAEILKDHVNSPSEINSQDIASTTAVITSNHSNNLATPSKFKEFAKLFTACMTVALSSFFEEISSTIILLFLSQSDSQETLNGFGLGLFWLNSAGLGIFYGIYTGLETILELFLIGQ